MCMRHKHRSPIPKLEGCLIGAMEMVEAGIPPSKAVTIGVSPEEVPGVEMLLGVTLEQLDRMSFPRMRALFSALNQ